MNDLNQFNIACEQLLSGKYILIDIKVSAILKIIEENEKLKNIVSRCSSEHDFSSVSNEEYLTATIPSNENAVVSYVYNFLYRFKNNDLNFGDNSSEILKNAIEGFIPPFQKAINSIFSRYHEQVETDEYQKNVYNKLKTTIKLIFDNIDKYKLSLTAKEEFTLLLNSLYTASEKNDKKLVYSLMIGIDYFAKANKKSRIAYLSLEECFTN